MELVELVWIHPWLRVITRKFLFAKETKNPERD